MKTITRVIAKTVITAQTISLENGEPAIKRLPNVTVAGNISQSHSRMLKAYLSIYPQYKDDVIIKGFLVEEKREMDLNVFLEHSHLVEEENGNDVTIAE